MSKSDNAVKGALYDLMDTNASAIVNAELLAPLVERALAASGGDLDKFVEWLRASAGKLAAEEKTLERCDWCERRAVYGGWVGNNQGWHYFVACAQHAKFVGHTAADRLPHRSPMPKPRHATVANTVSRVSPGTAADPEEGR